MASLAGLWRRYELKDIGLMAQPPSPEGYGGQGRKGEDPPSLKLWRTGRTEDEWTAISFQRSAFRKKDKK